MSNQKSTVSAYVLDSGKVINNKDLDKYEIKKSKEKLESAQLQEKGMQDAFKKDIVNPPYNPYILSEFLQLDTWHGRCVRQKAKDAVSMGWYITSVDDKELSEADKKSVEDFFNKCADDTFTQLMIKAMSDYESIGWGNIEVVFEKEAGKHIPRKLVHAPSHTMRKDVQGKRYFQIRSNKIRVFRNFDTDLEVFEKLVTKYKERKITIAKTSSILEIANYSSQSSYYGIPDWITAIGAIYGNAKSRDYNLSFFENHAVPRYAVIVEGGKFGAGVQQRIQQYFANGIKGKAHQTLILDVDNEKVKIKFVKLEVDIQDSSFKIYRLQNRDEVITAHGVPPRWIGVAESGKLGGSVEGISQFQNYLHSYILLQQNFLSEYLSKKLIQDEKYGLGIPNAKIEFIAPDFRDKKTESEYVTKYLDRGVLTINEVRTQFLDIEPSDNPMAEEHIYLKGTTPVLLREVGLEKNMNVIKSQNEWMKNNIEKLRRELRKIAKAEEKNENIFKRMFKSKDK